MSTEQNKAAVRRIYEECFSQGNFAVFEEVFAAAYVDHNKVPGQGSGAEGIKQTMAAFRTTFPDLHFTVEDMITEGDKVVARFTARGTDRGGYLGMPPTNRQGVVPGIDILRFENGKLVERWGQVDFLGLMMQLGLIPAPGH